MRLRNLFASAAALAGHLEAHSGPATFGCGHCGALYAALAALEEHRRTSHGQGEGQGGVEEAGGAGREGERVPGQRAPAPSRSKKIFGCSECEKLFRSPRDLERHVLVHTGEKPFPCLECGKFFATSATSSATGCCTAPSGPSRAMCAARASSRSATFPGT